MLNPVFPRSGRSGCKCLVTRVLPLLGLCVVPPPAARAQTPPVVRFTATQFVVNENATPGRATLALSRPLDAPLKVYYQIEAGTATMGLDFTGGYVYSQLEPGVLVSQAALVPISDDHEAERPETIVITLQPSGSNYTIGEPSTATLTILDDESPGPSARFEIADDIPLGEQGEIVLAAAPGTPASADIVVDPLPAGGTTVFYRGDADNVVHALAFAGTARQTIALPSPPAIAGALHTVNTIRILNPGSAPGFGAAAAASSTTIAFHGFLSGIFGGELGNCVACGLAYLLDTTAGIGCAALSDVCAVNCGTSSGRVPAPAGLPAVDTPVGVALLRRYRDEVLTTTPGGIAYRDLYASLSPGLLAATLKRPTLLQHASRVWTLWLPAVSAAVNHAGAAFAITPEMQAALTAWADGVAAVADPAVVADLNRIRANLRVDQLAGTTVDALQARIAQGDVPVRHVGWSEIKLFYR